MLKAEKGLQYFSIFAIVILSLLVVDLLNERSEEAEIYYVIVDNRIILENNESIEEIDPSEAAKIATFNIQVFGDTKMGKEEVVTELVEIFHRYDMVAVQEIKDIDQEVPYQFLGALNKHLLNQSENDTEDNTTAEVEKWRMVLSNRTGIQDDDINSQEQYAFYYRSTVFRALDNGVLYNDSVNDSFQREPLIARFMLLNLQGEDTGTELTFINIHTKPTLAVEEMTALGEVVSWSQANGGGDNVILLGDFNGDCSYASYNELVQLPISTENFTWLIPDDADTTVGDSRCAYDRIVSTGDLDGRLTGQWGVDEEISSSDVSDHRPVWFFISRL
jgi:endonuclease/exonuclease/phosphatase family metal-dependent hydrolase